MTPLTMNFSKLASRKQTRRDRLLLSVGMILIAFIASEIFKIQEQHHSKQATLTAPSVIQLSESVDPALRKLAESMAVSLNLPWYDLLLSLESVKQNHPDVYLTAVLPDSRKKQVILSGEVKQLGELLAFLDSLNASERFNEALLLNQQQSESAPERVMFSLKMEWQYD